MACLFVRPDEIYRNDDALTLNAENGEDEARIQDLLTRATDENRDLLIAKYVNGRTDIAKKAGTFGRLDLGQLAAEAPRTIDANLVRYRHSKIVMRSVRRIFQEEFGRNMRVTEVSTHIAVPELSAVAQRL